MKLDSSQAKTEFFRRMLKEFSNEVKPKECYGEFLNYYGFGLSDDFSRSNRIDNFTSEDCCFTVYIKESFHQGFNPLSEFKGFKINYVVRTTVPTFFSSNCGPDD